MPALLLSHRDLVVTLEDEHLVLRRKTQPAQAPQCVPLRAISRVDILGEPAISFAALSAIIRHAIPCHILSTSGRWRAMIDTASDTMAKRRSVQYQRTNERSFNLQVARQLLMAKVRTQRRVVQRLRAARPALAQSKALALQERTLSWAMARLKMAQDATALRGTEGAAARAYFATFPAFLPSSFPSPTAPFPTCRQAETLYPGDIPLSAIHAICVKDAKALRHFRFTVETEEVDPDSLPFQVNPEHFE